MDLEHLDCPQYVRFSSESFKESLAKYDTSSSSIQDAEQNSSESLYEDSSIEGNLTLDQESFTTVSTEEEYAVNARTTRSRALKTEREATIPKPFHFETDKRLKSKDSASVPEEKGFAAQLRQYEVPNSTTCGITKVKAFNLTEAKHKSVEGSCVPLAEQIKAFQKTPDRYRSTAANKKFQVQEHWSPPKFKPKTPNLQAIKRHRVVHALSREEQEAKELEEIRANEFHARPVDPRVYQPVIKKNKKDVKPSTKPVGINLKTSKRAEERPNTKETPESYEFHARPVPKKILQGPIGLGEKPEVKITKPVSPAFCTTKRLQKRKLEEEEHEITAAKKGKIVTPKKAKKSKPKPKLVRPVPTIVKPFSFDGADKQRFASKEMKIKEEIEKENKPFVFKAQPLPSPSASTLPKVERKSATKPEPFNFVLNSRSFQQNVSSKEETMVSFKAKPAKVLKKEPFIPEKPANHNIVIEEFELNTNRRASERLRLMAEKEAEERQKEQIKLARKAMEEEKERKEILKLRQEIVHKANPIRHYKPVEIKHSSKKLTEPISPLFETDKRLNMRHESIC